MKVGNKKTKNRVLFALSLAVCLIFSSVAVVAASPTYNMSSQYKSGKYYKNFAAVNMTGDGVQDTLAIALSQLGYHEGDGNDGLDGLDIDGNRDFAEFNVLYGKLDNNQGNGISYGYYWCASFVNWCLRQAEVSREASAAAEVSCRRWLTACKSSEIYHEKKGYVPKSADIIFFKEADSLVSSTHMGLVLRCDGKTVYTIEGNTSNGSEFSSDGNYVALKSYALTSSYIVGYATPKYNAVEGLRQVDYSGEEPTAGQYVSIENTDIYADDKLEKKIGVLDAFTVFSVDETDGKILKITLGGGRPGYIGAEKAMQINVKTDICSISYVNSSGKKIYSNQYAHLGDSITVNTEIPEKSTADFLGWALSGNDSLLSAGEKLTVDGNITLSAVYSDTAYLVSFIYEDGVVIAQQYGKYGDDLNIPQTFEAPDGFEFVGWGDCNGNIVNVPTNLRENATFVAVFEENKPDMTTEMLSQSTEESADKTEGSAEEITDVTDTTDATDKVSDQSSPVAALSKFLDAVGCKSTLGAASSFAVILTSVLCAAVLGSKFKEKR